MTDKLRLRDGVITPSGKTGKVYSLKSDGSVLVRLASGSHAGQIRRFLASSLRKIG
jgi:hypothetical protein